MDTEGDGLEKIKKEDDMLFEFVDSNVNELVKEEHIKTECSDSVVNTEVVKEEHIDTDSFIKCEKCNDNSSETDCELHGKYIKENFDVPGVDQAEHQQRNGCGDVKPKVENEEYSSASKQTEEPTSNFIIGEVTVKQEVPFDTPEYVLMNNEFVEYGTQQIKTEEDLDISCEDFKVKAEPLVYAVDSSQNTVIQDEDSREDFIPGPSKGPKTATATKTWKRCTVPSCDNCTNTAPKKVFFPLPKDKEGRLSWQRAMGKTDLLGDKTVAYCCEDHFKLEDDTENYMQFRMMGNVKLKLKPRVVPSCFECRQKPVKRALPDVVMEASGGAKRARPQSAKDVRHQGTQTDPSMYTSDVGVQVDLSDEEDSPPPVKKIVKIIVKKRGRKPKGAKKT